MIIRVCKICKSTLFVSLPSVSLIISTSSSLSLSESLVMNDVEVDSTGADTDDDVSSAEEAHVVDGESDLSGCLQAEHCQMVL